MPTKHTLVGGSQLTYYASIPGLALAASAGDFFTLTGAPGRVITPVMFGLSGIATAAGAFSFVALKRSTPNTGGTATTPTPVPAMSLSPSGIAVPPARGIVRAYTANPTPGTLVGNMMSKRITLTTAAGAIPEVETNFDFRGDYRSDVMLLSEQEVLALNLNGVTVTGGAIDAWVCWTEESGF